MTENDLQTTYKKRQKTPFYFVMITHYINKNIISKMKFQSHYFPLFQILFIIIVY